jgi:hypothetical protein
METHHSAGWKIETSEHEAQGFVTCTAAGAIVWRGPLAELGAAVLPHVEAIYCHDDDVGLVTRKLSKDRKAPQKNARQG